MDEQQQLFIKSIFFMKQYVLDIDSRIIAVKNKIEYLKNDLKSLSSNKNFYRDIIEQMEDLYGRTYKNK